MSMELVKASSGSVPAVSGGHSLPVLVERAVGAARFAWDEFFYAEHDNPHTQKAYTGEKGDIAQLWLNKRYVPPFSPRRWVRHHS